MHLKNIILFFFVTLPFFQCQGSLTKEKIDLIRRLVPDLVGQRRIDFVTIREIFSNVADSLHQSFQPSTLDELEKIEFSEDDVITYALAFVASENPTIVDSVNEIIAAHVDPDEVSKIDLEKLQDLLIVIEEKADPSQTFPATILEYIIKALKKTSFNRLFSMYDVKTYALAFAVSSDQNLMNFTESLVRLNRNGDGMGYRAFKTVIERIKQAKHIETPVPTYDDFEEACLGHKFTVNGIENMIIEKLFPL